MKNGTFAQLGAMLAIAAAIGMTPACATDTADDVEPSATSSDALSRKSLSGAFQRVVIGRIFQHDIWTLPAADTYRPEKYATTFDRRVAYVCDTYAELDPTFVSGLVRFDGEEAIDGEPVKMFKAVRKCLRDRTKGHAIRFDVVLNALHYADPKVYSGGSGGEALVRRLKDLTRELDPDLFFFDFYTVPFVAKDKDWNEGAIVTGIEWIHRQNRLVGGNVVGNNVPKGTDFAAVDDSAGPERLKEQANALRDEAPLLMHIQNDPQIAKSQSNEFFEKGPAYRANVVEREAGNEQRLGYAYMFPVFFPLLIDGKNRIAYDARQDGDMLARMKRLIAK